MCYISPSEMIETWRRLCEMCVFSLHEFTLSSKSNNKTFAYYNLYSVYDHPFWFCWNGSFLPIPAAVKPPPFPTPYRRSCQDVMNVCCALLWPDLPEEVAAQVPWKLWRLPMVGGWSGWSHHQLVWFLRRMENKRLKNHGTWKTTIEYCKEMICDNVTICFFCEKSWWNNHCLKVVVSVSDPFFVLEHEFSLWRRHLQGWYFWATLTQDICIHSNWDDISKPPFSINKWVVCWTSHLARNNEYPPISIWNLYGVSPWPTVRVPTEFF